MVGEDLLEVESTCVTPDVVLQVSGHVDKFTDYLVRDKQTNECYRADHVLEGPRSWLLSSFSHLVCVGSYPCPLFVEK